MATPAQVLKDPNFLALPVEERRKVLTAIDPNFGILPKAEQDKVFGVPSAPAQPFQWPGAVSAPMYNRDGKMVPKDVPLSPLEETAMAPLNLLKGGAEQAGEGYTKVLHPQGADDFAGGLADSVIGTGTMMLPFFAPGMAAHPLATAIGLGTFGAAGGLTEAGLNAVGVPPGFSKLGSTVIGGVAGWKAGQAEEAAKARLAGLWNKPGVKSALADFIPYWGPETGYRAKVKNLGIALAKDAKPTKPAPFMPMPPDFLDPYSNPPSRSDPYSWASGPSQPIPVSEMRVGVGSRGDMEYGGPPPKPKAAAPPKEKPPTKEAKELAKRSLDPYEFPPARDLTFSPGPPDIPSRPSNTFPRPPEYPPVIQPRSNYNPPAPGAPAQSTPPPFSPVYRAAPPDTPITPSGPPPGARLPMEYETPAPKLPPPPEGEENVSNEYKPKPKVQLPKTPEEIDAAVKKAAADREARIKTAAPGLPPPPEGSIVVSPAAGMHPDYTAMIAEHGTSGAEAAMAKDMKIAAHLKAQGIKPEQWNDLSLAEKNVYVAGAGKYRALGKGGAKGRSAEDGAKHIYNRLVELWK